MAGRRPTRRQMGIIASKRLNPRNWLVSKAPVGELHLVSRYSSQKRVIKNPLGRAGVGR